MMIRVVEVAAVLFVLWAACCPIPLASPFVVPSTPPFPRRVLKLERVSPSHENNYVPWYRRTRHNPDSSRPFIFFASFFFEKDNKKNDDNSSINSGREVQENDKKDVLSSGARDRVVSKLLSGRKGRTTSRPNQKLQQDATTSVGARRVGSATRSRQNQSSVSTQLFDSVKRKARAADKKKGGTKMSLETSRIHSTIADLLRRGSSSSVQQNSSAMNHSSPMSRVMTAAFSTFQSIGVLGDPVVQETSHAATSLKTSENVHVRMATPHDDIQVANLRLSVFSDFPRHIQSQFCARSCQAMASRRLRGARCLVAMEQRRRQGIDGTERDEILLGSAECSFHEFFGTTLGLRRPRGSILYVTEVAVNPSARRQGVGAQLMDAVELLAREAQAETLYLHVDVLNRAAIGLYEKTGYRRVESDDSMYYDFTKSLNLHPGAVNGKNHFLYHKNIVAEPTWLSSDEISLSGHIEGKIGFEVPC